MQVSDIQRQHVYFGSGPDTLFGWLHGADPRRDSDTVAVICNPLGTEYMSGHRSIRHLADRLCLAGIPALRFDYCCTGDSSGGEFRNLSLPRLVRNAIDAAREARMKTGATRVTLLGIGIGATIAALAADREAVSRLILWNPTVNGRRFLREQKLLSGVLESSGDDDSGAIDSAGLYLTKAFQDEFSAVDLTKLRWDGCGRILLVGRSDLDARQPLVDCLAAKNLAFDYAAMPGYREMMDQPTDTVVPTGTIDFICGWLRQNSETNVVAPPAVRNAAAGHGATAATALIPHDDVTPDDVEEIPEMFGPRNHLFGIATMPAGGLPSSSDRAFVFLNCGSEHHAGPHRMYTILCRKLAGRGEFCFRFDIEGIGDSVTVGNNEDNNAYSPAAIDDIDAALQYLTAEYGCRQFILCGICAGAYHAFKAAATLRQHDIRDAILVNPLVFEWNYDDPEDHLRYELHTYQAAVKNRRNWWRLLTGDINYRRLLLSVLRYGAEFTRRTASAAAERIFPRSPDGLPGDMQMLQTLGRPLTLILSEGDPGLSIMLLQARRQTKAALRNGSLSVHHLERSNHGLSKKHMQDRLVSTVVRRFFSG